MRSSKPRGPGLSPSISCVTQDRGGQSLSIRYAKRLADAGIDASVGSVGDSYDTALAESVTGPFKTEVTRCRAPWRDLEALEMATLE